MSRTQLCEDCGTYYREDGEHCPRCAYQRNRRNTSRSRKFFPERPGARWKPGDSEVRVVRAAYRDR